jgi:hypothetical protein
LFGIFYDSPFQLLSRLRDEQSYGSSSSGSIADTSTRLKNTVTSMEGQIGSPSFSSTASSVYLNEKDRPTLDNNIKIRNIGQKVNSKQDRNDQIGKKETNKESSSSFTSIDPFENVLYVLGVAGLASQRLLQKHTRAHTPNKHQQVVKISHQNPPTSTNSVISSSNRNTAKIDTSIVPSSSTELPKPSKVRSRDVSFDLLVSNIRGYYLQSFIHQYYQNRYKRRQVKLLLTTMICIMDPTTKRIPTKEEQIFYSMNGMTTTTKRIQTLWITGGGKRNTNWTLNTMAVFILCSTMGNVDIFGKHSKHHQTQYQFQIS